MHAMVTVRTGSTRLPNKCMLDLDGMPVLSHVLTRCRNFGFTPIVATTNLVDDDIIETVADMFDVPCYRGPVEDKMTRWLLAALVNDVDRFVVVDCDDPFFDPTLTRMMYMQAQTAGFVFPDMRAYLGSHGMGVSVNALAAACAENRQNNVTATENVMRLVAHRAQHVEIGNLMGIEHGLRLTLDYPEDYWLISTVQRH